MTKAAMAWQRVVDFLRRMKELDCREGKTGPTDLAEYHDCYAYGCTCSDQRHKGEGGEWAVTAGGE